MEITKIVLTGGPCAGKTTAKEWIHEAFTKRGYNVLFIQESATEFIDSGLTYEFFPQMLDFEEKLAQMQRAKERIFLESAELASAKTLIVCDRGVLDCKAYISQEEFDTMMQKLNTTELAERDKYDAVFHLVSAADGAEEMYTLNNNKARKESVAEAVAADKRTQQAWVGHPHLRVIDNSTDFQHKMERLIEEISSYLGEPEPFEIERKFLIQFPDISLLEALPNCKKVEITQTYLESNDGVERRIRKRGLNDSYYYWVTEKQEVSKGKRIEKEERITEREYLRLFELRDPSKRIIHKTRYCLLENSQYFEIDIYPEWTDKAILEVELTGVSEAIHFPASIKVLKEVTGEKDYSNYGMASR